MTVLLTFTCYRSMTIGNVLLRTDFILVASYQRNKFLFLFFARVFGANQNSIKQIR